MEEYRALVAKVSQFVDDTNARRAADMRCREGCDACCQVWLSVSPVEADAMRRSLAALPDAQRAEVRARGIRELGREADAEARALADQPGTEPAPRCAMLDDRGSCAVYADRPLVCRTQGHALRYPADVVPAAAVRARSPQGEVTWCPLNYTEAAPGKPDILDAERVDQLLSLVNLRHVGGRGAPSGARAEGPRELALARVTVSALAAADS